MTNATYTDALTWNSNWSLKQQAITDSANSTDTQTCNYAHDDLSRISSANCGSIWSQTYSYDPFGNISTSGAYQWLPGYNTSTNRYALAGTSYDGNGNLLNDTFHTYTWDAEGNALTIYQNPNTYGFVRDAFDRIVEYQTNGTATNEFALFGPFKVVMNGQALASGTELPLVNGIAGTFLTNGAISTFHMPDWLGSRRVYISYTGGGYSQSLAYAPFGEPYAKSSGYGTVFTGKDAIVCGGCTDNRIEYGFPTRIEHPIQGRWISPDPAGLVAANLEAPQSWNRYAYVMNNPLSNIDPTGMACWLGEWALLGRGPGGDCPGNAQAFGDSWSSFTILDIAFSNGRVNVGPVTATAAATSLHISDDPLDEQVNADTLVLSGGNISIFYPSIDILSYSGSVTWAANNCTPGSPGCYNVPTRQQQNQLRLNQASQAAWHTFLFGQAIGTGVGCGVGALVAAGGTAATETYPLAGATVPAGCIGGGIIGFFEALPYSTLGGIADFGWTYWGHH